MYIFATRDEISGQDLTKPSHTNLINFFPKRLPNYPVMTVTNVTPFWGVTGVDRNTRQAPNGNVKFRRACFRNDMALECVARCGVTAWRRDLPCSSPRTRRLRLSKSQSAVASCLAYVFAIVLCAMMTVCDMEAVLVSSSGGLFVVSSRRRLDGCVDYDCPY